MNDNPLENIGEVTKTGRLLIEKISDAVGGIFKPYQIIRVAKAEAEADRIRAESQIEITDLHRRALHRFLQEEAQKQSNMEEIIKNALPHLNEKAKPEKVEKDWITNFFDKSRIVSNEQMQQLWSRLLAEEANAPGTFSKRTVNLLADLDKGDAEMFMRFCGFCWQIGNIVPLIFEIHSEIYNRHGVNFNTLGHLDSLGLIQFNSFVGFRRSQLPQKVKTFYYGKPLELTFPKNENNGLDLGHALLTRAGHELSFICGSTPVEGFFDYAYDRWTKQSLVPKKEPAQDS